MIIKRRHTYIYNYVTGKSEQCLVYTDVSTNEGCDILIVTESNLMTLFILLLILMVVESIIAALSCSWLIITFTGVLIILQFIVFKKYCENFN